MQVMDEETKTGLWGSNLSGGYQVPTKALSRVISCAVLEPFMWIEWVFIAKC